MNPDIAVALIGLGSTLATLAFTFAGKLFWDYRKNGKSETFTRVVSDMHKVYAHLNSVVYKCGSSRAMVMYTENGGGKPTIGSQLFVSIVFEVHAACPSIREGFQRVRVDHSYVQMLGHMLSNPNKRTTVIASRMDDCLLKNIYKEAGTEMSIVYLVKQTDKRMYYASFNFPHENLTGELLYHCDLEAAALIRIFSKAK